MADSQRTAVGGQGKQALCRLVMPALVFLAIACCLSPIAAAQDSNDGGAAADVAAGNGAQTRGEACRAACERDYAICGDEGAAATRSLNEQTMATRIDAVRCQQDLRACLKGCKGL